MRKVEGCLILTLVLIFFNFAICAEPPAASPEGVKEASQGAPAAHSESAPGSVKAKEPFDSSLVIPKGPQWIGAPLMSDGTKISETGGRYVVEYNMPYAQVLAWYQEALKGYPDTRYRDWKAEMYIEDQGASRWHAIKISKTGGPKTIVTIQKDNWTWIIATLIIRFVGVFVVLLVLWLGLNISGAILKRVIKSEETKPAAAASA
jgi:hypothetical protein